MSSAKIVSRLKSLFLDGDNLPLLIVLSASIIMNVVGGTFMVQMFPTNPVMWAVLVFITGFNSGAVFLLWKHHRQEQREQLVPVSN